MKTIINWNEEATIADLLNSDAFEKKLTTTFDGSNIEVDVIDRRQFFSDLYAPVISGRLFRTNRQERKQIEYDKWIVQLKQVHNSELYFIEGYAGCGKSTFVQRVLCEVLEDTNYDYSYYNYNIGAYIGNKQARLISDAIILCCLRQIAIAIQQKQNSIVDKFLELLCGPKIGYFDSGGILNAVFSGEMFLKSHAELKSGIIDVDGFINKFRYAFKDVGLYQIVAMDYLFRIANYICGGYDKTKKSTICICYDNLDAIENFHMLRNFDDALVSILSNLDSYLYDSQGLFRDKHIPTPRFVTFVTYRKITVAKVELHKHNELLNDIISSNQFIFFLDASELFDFKDIVLKKFEFYQRFFDYRHISASKILNELKLCVDLFKMDFMNHNYSGLWNNNFRSCAEFIHLLFLFYKDEVVEIIKLQKKSDGRDRGHLVYGASAAFLNIICKLFAKIGLWNDDHLALVNMGKNVDDCSFNELTSLSRLILTYISNTYDLELRSVSTLELFEYFSPLYSGKELCSCLFNMLYRSDPAVWRRPLFYWKNAISDDELIYKNIEKQWMFFNNGNGNGQKFTELMISTCGKAYLNSVSTQFEFFSVRSDINNDSLYLMKDIDLICKIIREVYENVMRCCEKMKKFNNIFMEKKHMNYSDYCSEYIHPRTFSGNPQQHMERVIFAHILYINRRRMDLLFELTQEADIPKKDNANTRLLTLIMDYLVLYKDFILITDERRARVAKQLIDKVSNSLTSEDEEIKYQSIVTA